MRPSEKYQEFMQQSGYCEDPSQLHTLYLLDNLQQKIIEQDRKTTGFIEKIVGYFDRPQKQTQGIYIWGGVGRGKTFLMDIFYEVLPIKSRKRIHFHRFMQQIHAQIKTADKGGDPILEVAQNLARQFKVLCLDEFVVNDIADAMLVGRLLQALFDHGLILLTTSNTPPERLYEDGLQRENFLPAIDALMRHCQISNLDGGQDYRTLGLRQAKLYQTPHDEQALRNIHRYVAQHWLERRPQAVLTINSRPLQSEMCAEDMVWFRFAELCKTPRSRFDYLDIACQFSVVIVTGIEAMNDGADDVARRFISMIDVFYDHRVKLICSAEVDVDALYRQQFLAFEFQRTLSRLREMQTSAYMGQSHLL